MAKAFSLIINNKAGKAEVLFIRVQNPIDLYELRDK